MTGAASGQSKLPLPGAAFARTLVLAYLWVRYLEYWFLLRRRLALNAA